MDDLHQQISWWRFTVLFLLFAEVLYLYTTSMQNRFLEEPIVLGWMVALSLLLLVGTINTVRENPIFLAIVGLGIIGYGLLQFTVTSTTQFGEVIIIIGAVMIVEQLYKQWQNDQSLM
jgi:hypothetical protein